MMSMMRQVIVFRDNNHHCSRQMYRYFASYQLKCVDSMLCNNNRPYRLYRSSSSSSSSSRLYSSSCSRYSSINTTSSIRSCDNSDSNSVGEYSLDINDYLKNPHPKFNVPRGIVNCHHHHYHIIIIIIIIIIITMIMINCTNIIITSIIFNLNTNP
jgi:hypothetical protein